MYHQLIDLSPHTSKFCLASPAYYTTAKNEMTKQEALRSCVFRDFLQQVNPRTLKHHQWAVLARSHAAVVVQQALPALDIYEQSWSLAAPDIANFAEGCSDEAVPITALLHDLAAKGASTGNTWTYLTRLGVEQHCLTYVRWRNCFGGTDLDLREFYTEAKTLLSNPTEVGNILKGSIGGSFSFDFMNSPLKRELNGFPHFFEKITEQYLRRMVQQDFMFARKFAAGINVTMNSAGPLRGLEFPLAEVLPKLWAEVNPVKSQAAAWSKLETSGQPLPLNVP